MDDRTAAQPPTAQPAAASPTAAEPESLPNPAAEPDTLGPHPLPTLDRRARAWAEIDLGAVTHNYSALRGRLPEKTGLMAVLKANAYGHGAVLMARHLTNLGVSMIGVGDSSEALELRAAGIACPLLVLGAIVPGEMEALVANDVATCIHASGRAHLLADVAKAHGRPAHVHLKIDTGMGRLGVLPQVATGLAREIDREPWLRLDGVCTHYGSAVSPVPFHTSEQVSLFVRMLEEIRAEGIDPTYVHASNSAALFSTLGEHFNLVRVGLALYGLNPGNLPPSEQPLQPILSLRSQVVFLKDLPAGAPVGYNRTHVTRRPSRLAVIPMGYSDGLPYALSNRAHALIRGERAPIVGAISMDYTTLDVTDIPGVGIGDEVTLIGTSGKRRIGVEDLARTVGTIPYEITARLGSRVGRVPV